MVVVCEKCHTRFHLGDAKVPAKGARVRCSRCKHAFFITSPGSGEADAIDEVVAEVTLAGGAPVPEVAHDLVDPTPEGAEPRLHSSEGTVQLRAQERRPGDVEEDWEFNDDSPPGTEVEAEPELSEISEFDATALDLAAEPSGLEVAAERPDPIGESEPEMPPAEEPRLDPVEAIRAREAGLDSSSPDDLGSPEEWDFVGKAEIKSPLELAPDPVVPSVDEVSSGSPSPTLANSPTAAPAAPVEFDRAPLVARLAGLASIAGWILVGLGFSLGISAVFTQPGAGNAVSSGPIEISVSGVAVTAIGVEGRLVENALAGNLLVVSGELENRGSHPVTAGRAIQVQLVSATGEPVPGAAAAAGLALTRRKLREQDPDRLRRDLEHSAAEMAQRTIRPGERVRFDAVFESVPESAAGWVLRAATSPTHPDPGIPLPSATPLGWE